MRNKYLTHASGRIRTRRLRKTIKECQIEERSSLKENLVLGNNRTKNRSGPIKAARESNNNVGNLIC